MLLLPTWLVLLPQTVIFKLCHLPDVFQRGSHDVGDVTLLYQLMSTDVEFD